MKTLGVSCILRMMQLDYIKWKQKTFFSCLCLLYCIHVSSMLLKLRWSTVFLFGFVRKRFIAQVSWPPACIILAKFTWWSSLSLFCSLSTSLCLLQPLPTANIVTKERGCWQEVLCQVLRKSQLYSLPITIKEIPLLLCSPALGDKIRYRREKNWLITDLTPHLQDTFPTILFWNNHRLQYFATTIKDEALPIE